MHANFHFNQFVNGKEKQAKQIVKKRTINTEEDIKTQKNLYKCSERTNDDASDAHMCTLIEWKSDIFKRLEMF